MLSKCQLVPYPEQLGDWGSQSLKITSLVIYSSSFQLFPGTGHPAGPFERSFASAAPAHTAQPSEQPLAYSHHAAQQRKGETKSEPKEAKAARIKFFGEPSWTKPFICLSCKNPTIHILSIWRCHEVEVRLRGERTTRAISLYHILPCAMQPQAHNSRKTAWNSSLPEYYLLNISCLAGSWNNRWIKGSRKIRKITLSGGREWELRGKYQK